MLRRTCCAQIPAFMGDHPNRASKFRCYNDRRTAVLRDNGQPDHGPVKDGLSIESAPHLTTMCGRYASFLPAEFIARLFATVNPLPNLAPTWNMAPTMDAPVVHLNSNGERHLDVLKWGLVPYFTKDLKKARKPINARSETVAKSGMFRAAFAQRRCLAACRT